MLTHGWRVWPLRDQAGAWVGLAAVAGVGLAATLRLDSLACGGLAMLAVLVTLAPLWAPVSYQISPTRLEIYSLGRCSGISWSRVRGYRLHHDGATLYLHSIAPHGRKKRWTAVRIRCRRGDLSTMARLRRRLEGKARAPAA